MKKLLGILAAVSITASSTIVVVSCNSVKVTKKDIKSNEISNKVVVENIYNLESLDAVNTKLADFVNRKTIPGLTGLTAVLKDDSQTDVIVKITIDKTNYNLVGENTFEIIGAIKDKTKTDINSDDIINSILSDGDIENLESLDEVNEKLVKKASNIEGVLSLTADFNYQKKLFTSVIVKITVNTDKYNLINSDFFEIPNAIKKREIDINKAKDLASNQIKNLESLDQVKISLNKIMDYFNEVHDIIFINSFTAEMNNGSKTDVKVTLNVNEDNVELINGNSFVLEGAIKIDKTNILNNDIQNQASVNIQNLTNLDEVNTKLSNFVKSNTIPGLTDLTANLKYGSQTDVIVTIKVDTTSYNLVGGNTFEITGAIKDKSNNKTTIDRQALVNEANLYVLNLDNLEEVNNELSSIAKNYQGVTSIKADYKYFFNIRALQRDPSSVHVTIKIDKKNYVLSGDETFDIAFALITSKPTIYIDDSGHEVETNDLDISRVKAKEIKQIGFELVEDSWFEWKIKAVRVPQTVTKVPKKISNQITDMSYMFDSTYWFNQDISQWDTSNVTNMEGMFRATKNFNQPINNWNTSNVTNMSYMFNSTDVFNQDLNNWNTSKVTDMERMFFLATSFNGNLSDWDTHKVENMRSMFNGAKKFNQPINNWNTSNVTNMSYMFDGAKEFNQDLSTGQQGFWPWSWKTWDTSKVETMQSMFYGAEKFNQDLSNWNVDKVKIAKDFDLDTNSWTKKKPNFKPVISI